MHRENAATVAGNGEYAPEVHYAKTRFQQAAFPKSVQPEIKSGQRVNLSELVWIWIWI